MEESDKCEEVATAGDEGKHSNRAAGTREKWSKTC